MDRLPTSEVTRFTVAGLFAGIGGIELGLASPAFRTVLLCEVDPGAAAVLRARFPGAPLVADVRELKELPAVDILAAGFPCQDLSQAGRTAGIGGKKSGLVDEVFRLLDRSSPKPRWVLLENVPFMLQLDAGSAMTYVTQELSARRYRWAYRVIDTRAFGLPQRRRRVVLLASQQDDPRSVLLSEDHGPPSHARYRNDAFGFYWTEGIRGLGWAVDAVPTLKGGSTIGIPSPPAVWLPTEDTLLTPDIRDAERLQGFPADWTVPLTDYPGLRHAHRWKLVGNAVSVPLSAWIRERFTSPHQYDDVFDAAIPRGAKWPNAGWALDNRPHYSHASEWPVCAPYQHLRDFLQFQTRPLSAKATAGFLRRAQTGTLRFHPGFLGGVETHLASVSASACR